MSLGRVLSWKRCCAGCPTSDHAPPDHYADHNYRRRRFP